MGNNINNKSTPNQMREFMKRIRNGNFTETKNDVPSKELSIKEMLKITRDINEGYVKLNEDVENMETVFDQKIEEKKFRDYFNDLNVSVKFIDLEVYDNLIFWGGTVDGVIDFVFKVTPNENTSDVEFNYRKNFSPDNPENSKITDRIESYFNNFYR